MIVPLFRVNTIFYNNAFFRLLWDQYSKIHLNGALLHQFNLFHILKLWQLVRLFPKAPPRKMTQGQQGNKEILTMYLSRKMITGNVSQKLHKTEISTVIMNRFIKQSQMNIHQILWMIRKRVFDKIITVKKAPQRKKVMFKEKLKKRKKWRANKILYKKIKETKIEKEKR